MRNKCFGCEYFEGFKGCIVKCGLGHQNINIKLGCSNFTPDNTAECGDCFYKKGMINWIIDCSVRGKMDGTQTYCYEYARKEDIDCDKKQKDSGCFVTTAVCDILGKDDNCIELETLRKFRDEKLLTNENLKHIIDEYYKISPKYVNKINNHKDKITFAEHLLNKYINQVIENIQRGNQKEAVSIYKNMLMEIEKT